MTDSVTMTDTAPDMSEHNKAMEDKFDKANQPPADEATKPNEVPQRPENVPEKFWNAETGEVNTEALLKSYGELEKNQSTADESDDDAGDEGADDASDDGDEPQGIDFQSLSNEYLVDGELSEESYKALEEAGIPKEQVDAFIEGQEAIAQLRERAAFDEVGGEDNFRTLQEWASKNLSPEEIEEFDNGVIGSQSDMLNAVRSLHDKYVDANGQEPSLQTGNGTAASQAYESLAQMKADMKDPRYKTDPAFRKEVERKLAKSNIF